MIILRSAFYVAVFQSTLPHGSDFESARYVAKYSLISIHAPSRERHNLICNEWFRDEFQSTLPRGSDRFKAKLFKILF